MKHLVINYFVGGSNTDVTQEKNKLGMKHDIVTFFSSSDDLNTAFSLQRVPLVVHLFENFNKYLKCTQYDSYSYTSLDICEKNHNFIYSIIATLPPKCFTETAKTSNQEVPFEVLCFKCRIRDTYYSMRPRGGVTLETDKLSLS